MRFQILSTIALAAVTAAGTVKVQNPHVRTSLNNLEHVVEAFDKALAKWKGSVADIGPLLHQSSGIITAVEAAASVPRELRSIKIQKTEEDEDFDIINRIIQHIESAANTAIDLKPKFEEIPFVGKPTALGIIRKIHGAVSKLSVVYVLLASEARREDARALAKRVDNHIGRAMSAYE